MPVAHPSQGEHFFLRLLLTVKRGARSYRDLYTINGVEHSSPSAACQALGLISDESEWVEFINQIKDTATAHSLRRTLASIIVNSSITSAQSLWDRFKDNFTDDCLHRLSTDREIINPPPSDWTEDECRYDYGLWLLGDILRDLNRDWASAYMSLPRHIWVSRSRESNQLILDALNCDRDLERQQLEAALLTFSPGQRSAFDTITHTIDNGVKPNTFFLQGPAGTE
ncbi:putative transcriptional factor b3 [Erysiphe necator]|uniref:Putative transcriptional factor b3 n=1 Tax=Uncinula necator TaxID=52586 RepID=A0A0B1P7Z5_UNCNE|nr:putative transcriptional factor b3 [Erysiphe necator]